MKPIEIHEDSWHYKMVFRYVLENNWGSNPYEKTQREIAGTDSCSYLSLLLYLLGAKVLKVVALALLIVVALVVVFCVGWLAVLSPVAYLAYVFEWSSLSAWLMRNMEAQTYMDSLNTGWFMMNVYGLLVIVCALYFARDRYKARRRTLGKNKPPSAIVELAKSRLGKFCRPIKIISDQEQS